LKVREIDQDARTETEAANPATRFLVDHAAHRERMAADQYAIVDLDRVARGVQVDQRSAVLDQRVE
jgi:hypothetical protein